METDAAEAEAKMETPLAMPPPTRIRVIHHGGNEWSCFCPYFSPLIKEECRRTPGMRWSPERRAWVGYVDAVDAAARRLVGRGVRIDMSALPSDEMREASRTMYGTTNLIAPIATRDLRDYQKIGVEFGVAHAGEGVIIADDVGLGKTLELIRIARALRGKTVIGCPEFLRGVWETGIRGDKALDPPTPVGWPGVTIFHARTTKPSPIPPDTQVVIVNYTILHDWLDTLIEWEPSTLLLDEIHMLMGDKARRTRAAEKLGAACAHRAGASATPMMSRPRDLWAPVNIISAGRLGTDPWAFYKLHCAAFQETIQLKDQARIVWNTKGSSNLEELQRRINFFMLRRTKSEVRLQLPPKQRQIIEVNVDKRFVVAIAAALKSDASLQQALQMASDGKLPDVVQLVLGHVHAGHKVIVGCWRRVIAEAIANAAREAGVASVGVIHGEIPQKKRDAAIKSKPDVTCITYGTSVGIDLSYADVGVAAELTFLPSEMLQWEGRYARFRQKNPVLVQYVVGRGTADELIRDGILRKLRVRTGALGKHDDEMQEDIEAIEKSPAEQLKSLYDRIVADQAQKEDD